MTSFGFGVFFCLFACLFSGDRVSIDLEPDVDPGTGSIVEQAGLEHKRSASLCLLSGRIKGLSHHRPSMTSFLNECKASSCSFLIASKVVKKLVIYQLKFLY